MRRSLPFAAALSAMALLAACSGGGSITDSGSGTTPVTGGSVDGTAVQTTQAPTTTTPLDTLPDCPTELPASGTTEISFWHGMSGPLGDEIIKLTDAYNASQTKVKVNLVQNSYEVTADNYYAANTNDRPDIVQMPEYQVQAMFDTDSAVPVAKCIASSGYDTSAFLPAALAAYATAGVQWSMPFNISNPVLFYNKRVF